MGFNGVRKHQKAEDPRYLYPHAELAFLTPLHRITEDGTVNEIGLRTAPLSSYVTAVLEVAGYYGLPVLDLLHTSGLHPKLDSIRKIFMLDGLHPSDAGAARIARRLHDFLQSL